MIEYLKNKSLRQSLLFGLLIATVFALIWNSPFKKHMVELNPFSYYKSDESVWFVDDFNGDGNSERIRCFHGVNSVSMDVIHYDTQGNITGHYQLGTNEWPPQLVPAVIDLEHDNKKELIFFSLRNDSIFLQLFSLTTFELIDEPVFFGEFEIKRPVYACNSNFTELVDLNRDGSDEIFIHFDAGYGIYPRGVFRLDFPSMKIRGSKTGYMNITASFFQDLDSDGIPEIFTSCNAPNNTHDIETFGFADTLSYLTILDYDLNFFIHPIPFEGIYSSLQCLPDPRHKNFFYLAYNCRTQSAEPMRLMTVSASGEILKEKVWKNIENPELTKLTLQTINKKPYVIFTSIGRFSLNADLSGIPDQLTEQHNNIISNVLPFDLDNDRFDELIYTNLKDEIFIYNEKDRTEVKFESPVKTAGNLKIYKELEDGKLKDFMLTSLNGFLLFRYTRGSFYYLNYLIYFLVFAASTSLIGLILRSQKNRMEQKWETEKQLSELQFNSVKNQLNPHFLFNALNSVALMIREGKSDEAYDFLSVNSRMIQRVMNDANEVVRPLADELQFTKDYVRIQQLRFKDRFSVEFWIDPDVDLKLEVPKMCIHTYVENAIKHGFRHTKKGGLLSIRLSPVKNGVDILIADNGMGRSAAAVYNDTTGNGIGMMNEFYQLFEKYRGYQIKFNLSDPVSGKGTIVNLIIKKNLES